MAESAAPPTSPSGTAPVTTTIVQTLFRGAAKFKGTGSDGTESVTVDVWSTYNKLGRLENYLEHGDLQFSDGFVRAPTDDSGWQGISMSSDEASLAGLKDCVVLAFDTAKLLAQRADGLAPLLLSDPTKVGHFGLAPARDCSRKEFDDLLNKISLIHKQ